MANLFRPEAIEARRQVWLGGISLVRPVSITAMTVLVLVCLAAVLSFLTFGQYTRKARLSGVLVPDRGVIRLVAPQAATVQTRLATEGQVVKKGDLIFVLSLDRMASSADTQSAVRATLDEREQSLRNASRQKQELARDQAAALDRRIADMRREQAALDSQMAVQKERLELAEQTLARWRSLSDQQFVSQALVQSKTEDVLAQRAQLAALDRQRAAQMRDAADLDAQRRQIPLALEQQLGQIDRDVAELAQKRAESSDATTTQRWEIRAPQDGVLTAVTAEPGQAVSPSAALASLLPAGAALQAQLYAPSSAIGFVRPQQSVYVRYQAFPYQKFGHQLGRVLEVSRTPLQPSEIAAVAPGLAGALQPMYRITVALDRQTVPAYGQEQPLAPGMQLDADVQLDSRRLIEWVFEPLLGLARRV